MGIHLPNWPLSNDVSDYTTITVSKEVKEDLESDIEDGETWNEYLQRLSKKPENPETESSIEVSDEGFGELKALLQALAEEKDVDSTLKPHLIRVARSGGLATYRETADYAGIFTAREESNYQTERIPVAISLYLS